MTLRTASAPYDPLTLDEWKATLGSWVGVAYASLSSTSQTEMVRIINDVHEFISQKFGHDPHAKREWTLTAPSTTDGTTTLAVDVRNLEAITETDAAGDRRPVSVTTKLDYYAAMNATSDSDEPWTYQESPHYFFDGWDNSDPPAQQWRRVPTPGETLTVKAVGTCYFGVLETDVYTQLPPSFVPAIRDFCRSEWAAFTKDKESADYYEARAERKVADLSKNDVNEGNVGVSRVVEPPSEFYDEISWDG